MVEINSTAGGRSGEIMDHGRQWFSRGDGDHGFRWEGKWRDEAMAMPITLVLTWWREEHTLGDDLTMWIA